MAVIAVENLAKSFNGSPVIEDISFQVSGGEVFGFLGPNGAGKTTTIRIVLGLLQPTAGTARVMGSDLGRNDALRRSVGVLLENNGLYGRLSAYDNLRYYADIYRVADPDTRIRDLLDLVDLTEFAESPIGNFSVGMQRKMGLARAIIHDPAILFLDEPTSGLDPEAQRLVRDLILDLSREKNRTVFLNSHNLDEVQRICTNVAILQQGRIRAYDSVEHLRASEQTPVYLLTLADPAAAERACTLVRGVEGVGSCSVDGDVVTVSLDGAAAPRMLRELVRAGVDLIEARRVTRSLEDVYLDVVHRSGGEV
ncbi:ABC transporter ATP-binding protein [Methanoculleus sp. FWC-SCC1]|uniref:ABC transporter ATP-binding protein n=1 Tax=Methanoculleus frigidifontis TaxID=2584085 RepID=A0ABT8MAQ9_9EURY|nr:ABC transporter ATP-binding protein [Methanoculleus sp. FWC-SCC1]MDN7025020.1 ABC transporter ATP-binding protein [Methanoculleus sp. FWC-SCC1]